MKLHDEGGRFGPRSRPTCARPLPHERDDASATASPLCACVFEAFAWKQQGKKKRRQRASLNAGLEHRAIEHFPPCSPSEAHPMTLWKKLVDDGVVVSVVVGLTNQHLSLTKDASQLLHRAN